MEENVNVIINKDNLTTLINAINNSYILYNNFIFAVEMCCTDGLDERIVNVGFQELSERRKVLYDFYNVLIKIEKQIKGDE